MEDSCESDAGSLSSSVDGTSSLCAREATVPDGDADAIPVTFIGDVSEDPVEPASFPNSNNNAGSSDRVGAASRPARESPAPAGPGQQPQGKNGGPPGPPAAPQDAGKAVTSARSPVEVEPAGTSAAECHARERKAGDADEEHGPAPHAGRAASLPGSGTGSGTAGGDKLGVSAAPSRCPQGHTPGGSFGLKYGLTTYKIVPPKSEMRCYDRGASLSSGAIKIDELGNLVSPHAPGSWTIALPASALEKESQPKEKTRGFWRSGSGEKPPGQPAPNRTPPAAPRSPNSRLGAEPAPEPASPGPKAPASPQQRPAHQGAGRHLGDGERRPPTAANATQVPFLKPQRRTSSQYVASAIAKRIGPPKAHAEVARRHDPAGQAGAGKAPPAAGDGAAPGPCPGPRGREQEAQPPRGLLAHTCGGQSAEGARSPGPLGSPHGPPPAADGAAGVHRSAGVLLATASQRDPVSAGQSSALGGNRSPRNRRAGPAPHPERAPDGSGEAGAPAGGPGRVPAPSQPPRCPAGSGTSSHAVPERKPEPSELCTDAGDADGAPSVFGPKKKFRPVVQRPAPQDTSLHSALMAAIHSAGGGHGLRKVTSGARGGGGGTPRPSAPAGTGGVACWGARARSGAHTVSVPLLRVSGEPPRSELGGVGMRSEPGAPTVPGELVTSKCPRSARPGCVLRGWSSGAEGGVDGQARPLGPDVLRERQAVFGHPSPT